MHPEIKQAEPGRCPKCGMELVPVDTVVAMLPVDDKGLGVLTWRSYLPLITIVSLILVVSVAVSWRDYQTGAFSILKSIQYFMAGFFVVFAGFKLIDLKGFAEGYFTYDLLAQKFLGYGYIYPFIELGFGLAMIGGVISSGLLWAEALVMAFSGLGVAIKLLRHEPVKCVCLGTVLKIPLTNVTLIEDFGMAALALILLLAK